MRPLSVEDAEFKSELSKMADVEYWDSVIEPITEYGLATDKDPYEPLTKGELAEFAVMFGGKLTIAQLGAMTPGEWEKYANRNGGFQYHTGGQYDTWYWYAREQHKYNLMMTRNAKRKATRSARRYA